MRAKGVCERVTTRWPDSRTAVRKPVKFNGLQGRSVYEDRNARISILAGRASSSRPDTLKQTDQPPISTKPPCRRGGPYVCPNGQDDGGVAFSRSHPRQATKGVCERVTTRWPSSRTALRKPGSKNGARRRDFYEDRNARISILAGRKDLRGRIR